MTELNTPDKYIDSEHGDIDRMQLGDDMDQYLSDDRTDEQLILGLAEELRRRVRDDETFINLMHEVVEGDKSFFLDQAGERYGYGIMNVHQNALIPLVEYTGKSKGYFENDNVVNSRDDLKKAFATHVAQTEEADDMSDFSHLRAVVVRLDNGLDHQCTGIGESILDMAENLESVNIREVVENGE